MAKRLKIPTLLVITENPSVRFWVKKHLSEQYFIIDASRKGEAFQTIRSSPLDFIILDSDFEESDPLELSRELRQELKEGVTPILLITGRLKRSYRDNAIEAGVSDFLSNQLDAEELKARIASGKKAEVVRDKTSELSTTIKAPQKDASQSFFKDKLVLHDQALRLLAAAKIEHLSVILVLVRIDGFAKLPQEIASEFAHFLSARLQGSDLMIPSSDGQFILLLPDIRMEEAKKIAETWRADAARFRFEAGYITVSIALTPLEATESSFNRMINATIKSLKQAKNTTISLDQEKL